MHLKRRLCMSQKQSQLSLYWLHYVRLSSVIWCEKWVHPKQGHQHTAALTALTGCCVSAGWWQRNKVYDVSAQSSETSLWIRAIHRLYDLQPLEARWDFCPCLFVWNKPPCVWSRKKLRGALTVQRFIQLTHAEWMIMDYIIRTVLNICHPEPDSWPANTKT